MAEDSEKRFQAILGKLFRQPLKSSKPNSNDLRSSSNAPGIEGSRGKKRPNAASSAALAVVGSKSRTSPIEEMRNPTGSGGGGAVCRPWDRDDLFRRLATFKSMTWFAKPQAVSAVNCARRGWINIDSDIITCESCGARLLFTTPSSWTQEQVEKAALVFSLKLDTGHKLLCPWVDNICDEKLAHFPSKPMVVLLEDYRKRCSVLLQLTALPLISSSAIDYMGSSELQLFLRGPSGVDMENSADASYYQVRKLISLFGWEPRLLPYIVDTNDGKEEPSKIVNAAHQSHVASSGLNLRVVCYSSNGNVEDHNDSQVSGRELWEPNSVALNCKFCGASVGLWAFSSVQRPLEFLRLVGYTEVDGNRGTSPPKDGVSGNLLSGNENPTGGSKGVSAELSASTSSNEQTSNLNLTIAGGPPPAKLNYKATISLPVIGRILRARLSTDSPLSKDQEMQLVEGNNVDQGVNQIVEPDISRVNRLKDMQVVEGGSTGNDGLVENVGSRKTDDSVVMDPSRSETGEVSRSGGEDNATNASLIASENGARMVAESFKHGAVNVGNSKTDDSVVMDPSRSEIGEGSASGREYNSTNVNLMDSENKAGMVAVAALSKHGDLQGDVAESRAWVVDGNNACSSLAKNPEWALVHKSMQFDPIRQHRVFCPWIASSGNSPPGWQQTLSALKQHKEFFQTDSLSERATSSVVEVDDPIASIRKLFSSPPAKRLKPAHAS